MSHTDTMQPHIRRVRYWMGIGENPKRGRTGWHPRLRMCTPRVCDRPVTHDVSVKADMDGQPCAHMQSDFPVVAHSQHAAHHTSSQNAIQDDLSQSAPQDNSLSGRHKENNHYSQSVWIRSQTDAPDHAYDRELEQSQDDASAQDAQTQSICHSIRALSTGSG